MQETRVLPGARPGDRDPRDVPGPAVLLLPVARPGEAGRGEAGVQRRERADAADDPAGEPRVLRALPEDHRGLLRVHDHRRHVGIHGGLRRVRAVVPPVLHRLRGDQVLRVPDDIRPPVRGRA